MNNSLLLLKILIFVILIYMCVIIYLYCKKKYIIANILSVTLLSVIIIVIIYHYIQYCNNYVHYQFPQNPSRNSVHIPPIIYKTGPYKKNELPEEINNIFEKTISDNPKYRIKYFDDEESRNFIKNNFDNSVLNAYDRIIPGAYKADLFRYCILYINGGVYSDLSQQFMVPLDTLINHNYDKLVLVRDIAWWYINAIQINFMAAIPKLSVYKNAIDQIVENVNNNYYGLGPLSPTGPVLFRQILKTSDIPYRLELEQQKDATYFIKTDKLAYIMHSKNHKKNLLKKNKQRSWYTLWKSGNIYINDKFQHSDVIITGVNYKYCHEYKKELFKNVVNVLNQNNIKYVLTSGNLLEYTRGEVIIQDDDIDIRFHKDDWNKWKKYCNSLGKDNIDYTNNLKYDNRLRNFKQQNINGIQIRLNTFYMKSPDKNFDIHCDLVKSDIVSGWFNGWIWKNVDYLFSESLRKIIYLDISTFAPNKKLTHKYLYDAYGKNYIKPILDNSKFRWFK